MSPEPMDERRLAEIEARAVAAAPPPWRACVWDPMERPHVHKDEAGVNVCAGSADLPLTPADADFIAHARQDVPDLLAEVRRLTNAKDGAYAERNKLVAWLARAALAFGWRAGVGQHPATDTAWEADWRTIVFIDTPAGQLSWHFHDSERPLLKGLPVYGEAQMVWDGHTTTEKYERLARATPPEPMP